METVNKSNEYPKVLLLDCTDNTVKIRKEDMIELLEAKVVAKTGDVMLALPTSGRFTGRSCCLNTSFKWHLVCDENGYLLLVPTKR